MKSTLNELRDKIHDNAKAKGFYDTEQVFNIGEKLALVTSELMEALEADRSGKYVFKPSLPEIEKAIDVNEELFNCQFESYVKNTFEDELADSLIRILDLCGALNIDIDKHVQLKMLYNSKRPVRHGKKY